MGLLASPQLAAPALPPVAPAPALPPVPALPPLALLPAAPPTPPLPAVPALPALPAVPADPPLPPGSSSDEHPALSIRLPASVNQPMRLSARPSSRPWKRGSLLRVEVMLPARARRMPLFRASLALRFSASDEPSE